MILLTDIAKMAPDDYVGFTFFIGYMAMMAASVFFFFERSSVSGKWKLSASCIWFDYIYCCGALLLHA